MQPSNFQESAFSKNGWVIGYIGYGKWAVRRHSNDNVNQFSATFCTACEAWAESHAP